jgi:hypothetical protein
MTHSHSAAFEWGENRAENLSDIYNSEAAQGFGGLIKNTFNKVTGVAAGGVDATTGFLSEYVGEDLAKVAATIITFATAGYLSSGQGPIYTIGLMGVAAGALYHSSDNIHPDSTVGQAIDFLTEDFVDLYQNTNFSSLNPFSP